MASDSRVSRPPRTSVWLEQRSMARRRGASREAEQTGGLDRARIVAATVRLLDTDGLAQFSMRRLAAELDVTAMSVYWYVDSKDDLLELALDAVVGEIELPDPAAVREDWREQLRRLAADYRAMLVRHPWLPMMVGQYLNVGPRSLAFTTTAQRIMARSGLAREYLAGALAALFRFVYGFGAVEANWVDRCRRAAISPDAYVEEVWAKIREHPQCAEAVEVAEAGGGASVQQMQQRDFAFGLECVLAGIEAMRDRTGPGAAGPEAGS